MSSVAQDDAAAAGSNDGNRRGVAKKKTQQADEELSRLSGKLQVSVPEVLSQSEKSRDKLNGDKAQFDDQLLTNSSNGAKKKARKRKKKQTTSDGSLVDASTNNGATVARTNTAVSTTTTSTTPTTNQEEVQSPPNTHTKKKKKKKTNKTAPIRPNRPTSSAQVSHTTTTTTTPSPPLPEDDDDAKSTLLSTQRFDQLPNLHRNSLRAITDVLKLTHLTHVQAQTWSICLDDSDVLARARTGTGKTLAYLLPALELVLREESTQQRQSGIQILIVSPTRELATQIHQQAQAILTYHDSTALTSQVVYGGTNISGDTRRFERKLPTILVATPGRLIDHLKQTKLSGGRPWSDAVKGVKVLVLDETDRLLDPGFQRDLQTITGYLGPRKKRRNWLFSATLPKEMMPVMMSTVREEQCVKVDCCTNDDQDGDTDTHRRVPQSYAIMDSIDDYVKGTVRVIRIALRDDPEAKMVVFFPTARLVGYFAEFVQQQIGTEIIEMHSKKSQGHRNKASDKFRHAKSALMFTSDVSARGVDYPDVTHVIQFGIPSSREQYIHRLGRTGRAGKQGQGWLILAHFERRFLRELSDMDLVENPNLLSSLKEDTTTTTTSTTETKLLERSAAMAYQAFLGFYLGHLKRIDLKNKEELVEVANRLSSLMGLKEVPSMEKRLLGKMGLKGVPGIVISTGNSNTGKNAGRGSHGGGGGGRGGGGRGGGRGGSRR